MMVVGLAEIVSRSGAFTSSSPGFDKTQIATVGLAARFEAFYAVVAGTTLGMILANIRAVILGDRLAGRLPLKAIRYTAAVVFAVLGVLNLCKMQM
jgi:putative Ca2+/H+ antiporter (TMEM165/GDT1 family)